MRTSILLAVGLVGWCFQSEAILTPNLLSDPGFESGTPVSGGVGGWETINGASFTQNYSLSGSWSLESPYNSSFINAPALQSVPATAGMDYTLSSWGMTPAILPSGIYGYVILFFNDAQGNLLGNYLLASTSLNSSTPVNDWTQMSITATAPAGTALAWTEVTVFNLSSESLPAGPAVYFDDVSLTAVPEPTVLTAFSAGILALGSLRRCGCA